MSPPTDFQALTPESVRAVLRTRKLGQTLHILEETPSTNTAALALAQKGAEDGTVVVAERQTAGRGRLGRRWFSPPGENLYCSVILRPTPAPDRIAEWLSWAPLLSAVATARAVQAVSGLHPLLKWPNDILVGHRKLGGVLCESNGSHAHGTFVVVGIGLNVNTKRENFPDDLREIATSLAAEAGHSFDRAALLAALLAELEATAESLLMGKPTTFVHVYTALCSTVGRRVRVNLAGGESVEGWADSIGMDGSLRIKKDGANTETMLEVRAGDVIHLR
ncbi:MAG: biotin--[acetyl-CoA-carboxylase] ligase [Nitrospirae bacterium]|nr:biotin--[acetyl-CoA-carboxylase] ligase [Nitrospirota bacterium]